MRIRKLTFCNLHALRGEFKLDFGRPPLSDTGLFAITGDTGSGKSTLLDAITLALYGRIHRYESGSKIDEVMTQGTGFCWAEVEFEVGENIYLARYERRRARNKPEGRLQPAARKLFQLTAEGKTLALTEKIREMDLQVEELTGLDFDRFTRSVLLAQGGFAAFLKAKKNERSALLEQITGTKIYSEISKNCYERYTLEAGDLDQVRKEIEKLQLPSEAERQALRDQMLQLNERLAQLHEERETLEKHKNRFVQLHSLEQEQERWHARCKKLEEEKRAFAPEQKRLQAHERALPLQRKLNALQTLIQGLQEVRQQEQKLLGEMEETEELFVAKKTALQEAEKKLENLLNDEERYESLFAKAEKLDAQIQVGKEQFQQLQKLFDIALREKEEAERSLMYLQTQLRELNRQAVALNNFFSKHSELVQLIDKEELIAHKQKEYLKLKSACQKAGTDRAKYQEELASLGEALADLGRETSQREQALKERERELAVEFGAGFVHDPWLWLKELDDRLLAGEREARGAELEPWYEKRRRAVALWAVWKTEREELQELRWQHSPLEEKHARASWALQQAEEKMALLQEELQALEEDLRAWLPPNFLKDSGLEERLQKLLEQLPAFQQKRKDLEQLSRQIEQLEIDSTHGQKNLQAKAEQVREQEQDLHRLEADLKKREAERRALFGAQSVEAARRKRAEEVGRARDRLAKFREDLAALKARQGSLEKQLAETRKNREHRELALARQRDQLQAAAHQRGFAEVEALQAALLSEGEFSALTHRLAALEEEGIRLHEHGQRLTTALEELRLQTKELEEEKLQLALEACRKRQEETLEQKGRLLEQEKQWDALSERQEALLRQKEEKEKTFTRWKRLNDLIGSADGKKFRTFAQSLTLRRLVVLANRHLQQLNPRYFLEVKVDSTDLELDIVDTHLANHRRSVFTLSGGESFLASLALALGLSDMVGQRARIRSLFIDEGFGSLDANTLDQALSTLEQLQGRGKTIGLISHVRAMQERIPVQVVLKKLGGGISTLEVRS